LTLGPNFVTLLSTNRISYHAMLVEDAEYLWQCLQTEAWLVEAETRCSPSRPVFDMFCPDMNQLVASPREKCALLADYEPVTGAYDELFTATGELRAHFGPLVRDLDRLGAAELKRRADTVRRLIHEQGITYNVYGDPRGMERPWKIDPVPFVVAADEWPALEAALIQRATLINRILDDCYGAQELIRSGWLPPALVFAQPDFLRPCHGIRAPQDAFLHFYAADLVRSPDGQWWVSSDRTQIPTGAGYALANRLVTSRILPEPFRDQKVQRLAGFFRAAPHRQSARGPPHTRPPQRDLLRAGLAGALPRLHAGRGTGPHRAG